MKKLLVLICLVAIVFVTSCNKPDTARIAAPAVSWEYDGNSYNASYIQLDFQGQFDGYYEIIATYEDAAEQNTLIIGLTTGVAAGSHTVGGYYVNYITLDKLSQFSTTTGFQVYNIDVTGYNGNFVSGHFSANNASGPVLTGNFSDIHSEP